MRRVGGGGGGEGCEEAWRGWRRGGCEEAWRGGGCEEAWEAGQRLTVRQVTVLVEQQN